jgi:polyketide synthase PksM
MSLPSYPFARERYWVDASAAGFALPGADTAAALHPLVQRNTSTLQAQRYSSTFTGHEFFLADHVVQGRKVLPGVAYLEMAREALAQAGASDGEVGAEPTTRLTDVVWTRPLVVDADPAQVHIALEPQDDGRISFRVLGHQGLVHAEGQAELLDTAPEEPVDLSDLRARCIDEPLSGDDCYARFDALGLHYGPALRGLETLLRGSDLALARLSLPQAAAGKANAFALPPSLLDAALQAVCGLFSDTATPELALPFAMQEVVVTARCPDTLWAWVRPSESQPAPGRVRKYDITLCDDDGQVCVQIKGFATRPADSGLPAASMDAHAPQLTLLAPLWQCATPPAAEPTASTNVLVFGGTAEQRDLLRRCHPQARFAAREVSGIAELASVLSAHDSVDHLIWIAPAASMIGVMDERAIEAQQHGVLHCFRLVKAVLEAGFGPRALQWSVFTAQTQAVHEGEAVHAAHAGVHGLVGAMAKEYPHWAIRLVDLPQEGREGLAQAFELPTDSQGHAWAWRGGRWHRQQLLPARVGVDSGPLFRRGGVYVVIGGAGGIGEVWTEHAIRQHGAQVVWVGRRALDAAIQAAIDRLAALGPAPAYLSADAADRSALARVRAQIRERFGAVHGVVHSAIVLRDQSLAHMDEGRFAESLTAKVDVSVRMAQVFGEEALDFVLFFSSMQSFSRAAGQGNYAAGCTFEDAFAQQLGQAWPCRVRVMNWGWWGSVGVVASDDYRQRMARAGLASIEPSEGMAALDTLLSGRASQLALLKTAGPAAWGASAPTDTVQLFAQEYPSLVDAIGQAPSRALPGPVSAGATVDAALREILGQLLCGQMQALGLKAGVQGTVAEVAGVLGLRPLYLRWLEQTLRALAERGDLRFDGQRAETQGMRVVDLQVAWAEWAQRKASWPDTPGLRAQATLVETTLQALPDILSGRVSATDVMFPESSMRLVEGVYKDNPVADHFNQLLADAVVAFVQARLRQDPQARLRLLEIGAGTGGSSVLLFERLRPYAAHIDEYCYTDLSKAFLFHAEAQYGPANPYLQYRLFDIGRPLAGQGIEAGRYDLVVATNVLHATPNIRHSVRNAKAALRTNGVLLLNEISSSHLFTHLSFGLLEGWWLYEDAELRIPGCPGLSAASWRAVLEDEGFRAVLTPAGEQAALGQQIIAAESDGVVRQALEGVAAAVTAARGPAAAAAVAASTPVDVAPSAPAAAIARGPAPQARRREQEAAPTEGGALRDKAVAYFKGLLSKALKLPVQRINSAEPLETYGIDSILVVEMTKVLQGEFQGVSSTLFFEYRSIDELVSHFLQTQPQAMAKVLKLGPGSVGASAATRASAAASAQVPAMSARAVPNRLRRDSSHPQAGQAGATLPHLPTLRHDVAIVGLSGRYAQARNVSEFWRNLAEGRNCITEVPAGRWDADVHFDPERGRLGKSYSKWGGFIDGHDHFDPLFFNISPRDAQFIDPQERLFLLEAYASIEDAGYTPGTLAAGGKVGVFAGVMNGQYSGGARYWSIANRVSYLFDFHGPSMAVDTACSSSLTALHLAMESLRSGACDAALVGGVNLIVHPSQFVTLSAMGMLSAGDRCRAFGDGADGFIDGEGVGVIALKPLAQAIADGDHVYGVVKATALNHGGRTNGYTVPNPLSQAAVISTALHDAGIEARTISYLEAHGTGTPLGDPIEIAALSRAFGQSTQARQFCAIGSVKSNIGHCESAAGIAGITKVLLQLQHGRIAPSLHSDPPNPHIDFGATPFVVQRELAEWKRPVIDVDGRAVELPRRAGISSFGAGGSNAHVVIEEYVDTLPHETAVPTGAALVVLSARNEDRLRERVRHLLAALAAGGWGDERLADLAFTLQVGREPMEERLALLARSMAELQHKLTAFLADEEAIEDLYRGHVRHNREAMAVFAADEEMQEAVGKWVERGKFGNVLDLWVKGMVFDWHRLYDLDTQHRPRRVSLPTYPFAGEAYWLDRDAGVPKAAPRIERGANAQAAPAARGGVAAAQLTLLAPEWEAVAAPGTAPPLAGGVLVIGGTAMQHAVLRRHCPSLQVADFAPGDRQGAIADALAAHDAFEHVVWIAPEAQAQGPADDALIEAQQHGVLHGFRVIKALLDAGFGAKTLHWSVLTSQTHAVLEGEPIHPDHAALHGLAGALAKEYPNWRVRTIDLPVEQPWPLADVLALSADPQGNTWAWRGGRWYRQHLRPVTPALDTAPAYRQHGVYVVIGGAGGIGQAWSEHVLRQHGAQVVWIGRRAADAGIRSAIDRLSQHGPAPHYIAADATDRAALQAACDEVQRRFGRIHGVVQSALVLGDQGLAGMDEARFAASLASKVDVSVRMAQVFGALDLDFALFFSSVQSFFRSPGQSNYAAGCVFKDAFAQALGRHGACCVKVMNWGWWGSVGVAAGEAYEARMKQYGLASIEPDEGWQALEALLRGPHRQLALLKTTAPLPPARPPRDGGAERVTARPAPAALPAGTGAGGLDDAALHRLGVAALGQLVGGLLQVPQGQIDAEESLATYGVDSISVTQLVGLLAERFADVRNAMFFDHPTIDALAAHFLATQRDALVAWVAADAGHAPGAAVATADDQAIAAPPRVADAAAASPHALPPHASPPASPVLRPAALPATIPATIAATSPAGRADQGGIAIVGMACRFPGADSVDAFWQLLKAGQRADNAGPARRWPDKGAAADAHAPQGWGAFLNGVELFDPGYFGISPLHAEVIDPQERLFLMSCWHALEDAGYGNDRWLAERGRAGLEVGVFVGVTAASYNLVGFEQSLAGQPQAATLSFASIANRVSHALGLTGPSLSVDTMCSSSLVALHMACESLRSGECAMAVAGGVNLNLHPSRMQTLAQGRLISEDGTSRSFGAGGRGFLAGEGVASVVLKPLAAALQDGDTIHAVIRGSAVGHAGHTLNYFAPSSRGQSRVMGKALDAAGLAADSVVYVELQCSGDEVTDAAEVDALKTGYHTRQRQGEPLRLGSVKPNIGHAEAAAGMAQLFKVVLQLEHRTLVSTLTGDAINPQLGLADARAVVQTGQDRLPLTAADLPRMGINAFGAGGTAAHLVVEAAPASLTATPGDDGRAAELLVLSARSRPALRRAAEALAHRLEPDSQPDGSRLRLCDVAHTLRVGRRAFAHRLAWVAHSPDSAAQALRAWLDGADDARVVCSAEAGAAPAAGEGATLASAAADDLQALARRWVAGATVDWGAGPWAGGPRRRVSLPGAPFELRAFWPGAGREEARAPAGPASPAPTPKPPRQAALARHPAPEAPAKAVVGAVGAAPKLLQSASTVADIERYIEEQVSGVAEYLRLTTVGIVYAVFSDKGVAFEERRAPDGSFALYLRLPSGAMEAADRLAAYLAQPQGAAGLGGRRQQLMGLATHVVARVRERLSASGRPGLVRLGAASPDVTGMMAAYIVKRMMATPFLVSDPTGLRLALPASVRSRKDLDQLRSQYDIGLRALPESQPYCELLAAILSGMLDGVRPGPEHLAAAFSRLAGMLTADSKLAFVHRLAASMYLAERGAGQEQLSMLMIGAGGMEFIAALAESAAPGVPVSCRMVSGWSPVAQAMVERGREQVPGVDFSALTPLVPGALLERLEGCHFDLVVVNLQDPCASEAADLLERRAAAGEADGLVFVVGPVECDGLRLIMDLTDLWPPVAGKRLPDAQALQAALRRAGYRQQAISAPQLSAFVRDAAPPSDADPAQDAGQAAEREAIHGLVLRTCADAVGDDVALDPARDLATAGLSSLTWGLVFARLQQRYGASVDVGLFGVAAGEALSVDLLARRLADRHLGSEPAGTVAVPSVPDDLHERVLQRLLAAGRSETALDHAARLSRGEFVSSRGQTCEYFECGQGPALIFLTALAFGKSIWDDQIREFGADHRLIFPHLPGHAGSVYTGVGFSFEDLADDLIELMDALGIEQVHLVGWCVAGNIAQLAALRHPRRLASLTLVCTTPTDARMRGVSQKDLEDYSDSPLLTYQMEFSNIYGADFLAPEVTRSLSIIRQCHLTVDPQALMNFISSLFTFDTRSRLQEIEVPTLVVAGSHDIAFPIDQVALLKKGIDHARFVVVEQAGHLPFLNAPDAFNKALRALLSAVDRRPRRAPRIAGRFSESAG